MTLSSVFFSILFLRKLAQECSPGFATREEPLLFFIFSGADWNFPRDGHPEGVHVGEFLSEVLGGGSSMRFLLGPLPVILLRLQAWQPLGGSLAVEGSRKSERLDFVGKR